MQLILVFAILLLHSAIGPVASLELALTMPSKFCVIDKVKRMLAYNCQDLRLKEIPQYMKSGVELMLLSENRIRDLSPESFSKYTGLKYLYLHENMIQTVEPGTFAQLRYLEVVDLSSNALTTLPTELFHMPYLRTLYAADNNLFNLDGDLANLRKPIKAPLSIISLSSCKLKSIPELGVLPHLLHANFSLNPMTNLDPVQIAPMCNLKTIDLSGTHMSGCVCQQVRSYLSSISVYIKNGPNTCDSSGACPMEISSNATTQVYAECLASRAALVQEERTSSIMIYAAIGSGCLGILILLCCCCIRNRKIARKKEKQKKAAAARRRARKAKEAAEQRLISLEQTSPKADDNCEKKTKMMESKIIRVDIEKIPLDDD